MLGPHRFSQSVEISRDHATSLVNGAAAAFDIGGKRTREIQGMQVKGVGVVQRLVIAVARKHLAHMLPRPDHDVVIEIAREHLRLVTEPNLVVVTEDIEASRHRIKSEFAFGQNRAHDLDALARQLVELARVLEADALDNSSEPFGIARGNEAAILA